MVKRREQKKRGVQKYKQRKIILLGVEGNNKTERLYFNNFNRLQKKYIIRFASGNETDPVNIVDNLKKDILKAGEEGFDKDDIAFAVFDTDTEPEKERIITRAKRVAKGTGIKLIPSNPCFEIWYILHFDNSTGAYSSNAQVQQKLKTYLPDYEKNADVFQNLIKNVNKAIESAGKLRKFHNDCGHKKAMDRNPMTDVDTIVKLLI